MSFQAYSTAYNNVLPRVKLTPRHTYIGYTQDELAIGFKRGFFLLVLDVEQVESARMRTGGKKAFVWR